MWSLDYLLAEDEEDPNGRRPTDPRCVIRRHRRGENRCVMSTCEVGRVFDWVVQAPGVEGVPGPPNV